MYMSRELRQFDENDFDENNNTVQQQEQQQDTIRIANSSNSSSTRNIISGTSTRPRTSITHPLNLSNVTKNTISSVANLYLSSCPGKKVRLQNNFNPQSRPSVNRDLESDLKRVSSHNVRMIVNCLDDYEMNFLGSPWELYNATANRHNINVIRIPIVEGSAPGDFESVDNVVCQIRSVILNESSVLAHCRGGIGRAGLIACCYYLKYHIVGNADEAITMIRSLRSPKAIETRQQEDYLHRFEAWLKERQKLQLQQQLIQHRNNNNNNNNNSTDGGQDDGSNYKTVSMSQSITSVSSSSPTSNDNTIVKQQQTLKVDK